jgi:hypothetical protein
MDNEPTGIDRDCPTCGVAPGEPCRGGYGLPGVLTGHNHVERSRTASEERRVTARATLMMEAWSARPRGTS